MQVQTHLIIAGELAFGHEGKRKTVYSLTDDVSGLRIALIRSQEQPA